MRQRKAKDLDRRLRDCAHLMIGDAGPAEWEDLFPQRQETYAEIGCGKGDFIIQKAEAHPERNFIAVEGQETVILRAMEKILDRERDGRYLPNLKFLCAFVENPLELFPPDSLSGLYLNFSDPWPKARHAKRRLTHRSRLKGYEAVAREGATLEFKTDNDNLFDFSIEEIQESGYPILEESRDLHNSDLEARLTMTEYERKFSGMGKTINYVKIALKE